MNSWRSSESDAWKNSPIISTFVLDFRSWRIESPSCIGDLDGDEEEISSKYYMLVCEKYSLLGSHLPLCILARHIRTTQLALACIYTKRANRLNFLSSTSSPVIHLDLKTNYNLVCREEGFDFCSVEKISSDLSLFFSFSLFPARASVHVWWDDELFQFDFHAHWRVSIIASYHLIQYYYNVNCEY